MVVASTAARGVEIAGAGGAIPSWTTCTLPAGPAFPTQSTPRAHSVLRAFGASPVKTSAAGAPATGVARSQSATGPTKSW